MLGPTDSRAGGAQRGIGAESARWVINATELAFREWDAELFSHKSDIVDSANRQFAMSIDPACHRYDAARAEGFDRVLRQSYVDIDTIIGQMLRAASDVANTRVMIVGDHGICANNVVCDINQRPHGQGPLFVHADETVDMRRRLSYTKGSRQGNEVIINLQGREETGVVASGDYEQVQECIIDALLDWHDPQGNRRAVCFALSKRGASMLGYWGSECGDVVFACNQGFTWEDKQGRRPRPCPMRRQPIMVRGFRRRTPGGVEHGAAPGLGCPRQSRGEM